MNVDHTGGNRFGSVGGDLHEIHLHGKCNLFHQLCGEHQRTLEDADKYQFFAGIPVVPVDLIGDPAGNFADLLLGDQYAFNIFCHKF